MSIEDPLTPKIQKLKGATTSDKTQAKVFKVIATEVTKDAKQSGAVPFKTGYLSDSPFRNASTFSKGEDHWDVPYAEKMHRTGGRTGVPNWDQITWDRNVNEYEEIAQKIIDGEVNGAI